MSRQNNQESNSKRFNRIQCLCCDISSVYKSEQMKKEEKTPRNVGDGPQEASESEKLYRPASLFPTRQRGVT